MAIQELTRRDFLKISAGTLGLGALGGLASSSSSPSVRAESLPTPTLRPAAQKKENLQQGPFKVFLPFVSYVNRIYGGMTRAEGSLEKDCADFHKVASWVESLPEVANCESIPMFRKYTQAEIQAFVPTLANKAYIHSLQFGNEPNLSGQDNKSAADTAKAVKWFDDAMITTRPDISVYYVGLAFAGAGLGYLQEMVSYWDNNPQFKPQRRINLNFHMYPCNATSANDCIAPLYKYTPDRKNLTLYKQQFNAIVNYVSSRPDIFSNSMIVGETGVITDTNWDTRQTIANFMTLVRDFYMNEVNPSFNASGLRLDGVFYYTDLDKTYYPLMSAYNQDAVTGQFSLNEIGNVWLPFANSGW